MSYQLISSIARNEKMARSLASSAEIPLNIESGLNELSKNICSRSVLPGAMHFCYHIVEKWHVLSAVMLDSEALYRIHHMALTEDEVSALQKNTSRPTPAGVVQALLSLGFWQVKTMPQESALTEPRMSASHLPDASAQQYWKRITGHKSNAMVLLTPPYLGKCLISIRHDVSTENVLHLLHESMWLTAARGWGKTFCTFFSGKATDFDTVDIAVTHTGSTQDTEFRLEPHHVPILTITADMSIKEGESGSRSSLILTTAPTSAATITQKRATSAAAEFSAEPYKYVEAQDYEIFDIKPPVSAHVRWFKYIGGLLTLTAIVYFIVSNYVDFASAPLAAEALTTQEEQHAIHQFVKAIHQHSSAEEQLLRIKATLQTDKHPRHAVLAESIDLLTTGAHRADGHPDNLHYLLTHATLLEVSPDELWNYYLKIATKDYPVPEWISLNCTPPNLQGWQNIFKKYPHLKQESQKNRQWRRYMLPIINKLSF